MSSAAAAAASLSFCLLRSLRYRSASGLILKILKIMSSFGSAWASLRFSSLAFFMVPKLRDSIIDLLRRVEGMPRRPAAPPKPGPPGADKRFMRAVCSCWRLAVAVAMDSEVRIRLSVLSK